MSGNRTRTACIWTGTVSPGRILATAAMLVAIAAPSRAQQIPTGYQEYFVLGHEQQVWNLLNRVVLGEGGGAYTTANGMNSVVSAVASADGQRLYYDHWEDGPEADLLAPVQTTTWILGDGNPANGDVCQWTTSTCAGDLITQGMDITFASNQGLPGLDNCPLAGTVNQIRSATREDGVTPVFSAAACWSLLVFFVLAMQCLPTLAVTAKESGHWKWAILQLAWMSIVAYVAAAVTFQLAS